MNAMFVPKQPKYPIIALWVHPRSMSTAVERVMRERGDLKCFHEPFMYYYYVHRKVKELPLFDIDPSQPTTFEEVLAHLFDAAQSGPVFFKDMSYYILPRLFDYPQLATAIKHVFLIRDPRKSIVSYYKLDPNLSLHEIGLQAQWQHVEWLKNITAESPIVVEAEAIQKNTKAVMGRLWESLDLPYRENAFEWSEDKIPDDWRQVSGWHKAASSSQGIKTIEPDSEDVIQANFDAFASNKPNMKTFLDHHRPYYINLKALAQS